MHTQEQYGYLVMYTFRSHTAVSGALAGLSLIYKTASRGHIRLARPAP